MNLKNKKLIPLLALGLSFPFTNAFANADLNAAFSFWQTDNWNEFNYLSNTNNLLDSNGTVGNVGTPDGIVNPGGGGQVFDTEFMFYKYDADTNNMSIGIQTGFDIVDGRVDWNGNDYYAGDLALSFDGHAILGDTNEGQYANSYEYAVDFGLYTEDGTDESIESNATLGANGVDPAGLYRVGIWDNDISNSTSSPFAMDWSPAMETGLITNDANSGNVAQTAAGYTGTNLSFWRTVSFNLDTIIAEGETFTVDSHWTMSCGNDNINGQIQLTRNTTTDVPEPSILALFSIGSLSLGFIGYRRRKKML